MKAEKIFEDLKIIDSLPAVYLKSIDSIALADLHLGYEGIAAEQGVLIPKVQFEEEMRAIEKILKTQRAGNLIINGDLKHEFSETSYHEFREVRDLLFFLKGKFNRVLVIKGNHDNFIQTITKKFGVELCDELSLGGYLFVHGHREIALKQLLKKI